LLCQYAEANRDKSKRSRKYEPYEFHPWLASDRGDSTVAVVTRENVGGLRAALGVKP